MGYLPVWENHHVFLFSLTGFGYRADRCVVCSYCSSRKWNESRGGERVGVHEGNRRQLEGKLCHSMSEKYLCRSSLPAPAKSCSSSSASFLPVYVLQAMQVSEMSRRLHLRCCYPCWFWSKRQKNVHSEGHVLWTTSSHLYWDYSDAKLHRRFSAGFLHMTVFIVPLTETQLPIIGCEFEHKIRGVTSGQPRDLRAGVA